MINHTKQRASNRGRGFTIVELMVVVALIAFFVTASIPLLLQIDELSRDRSGVNTIGVAVTAARAYSTRNVADDGELGPESDGFSGAAIIFTPQGELRIAQDVQHADTENAGQSAFKDILRTEPIVMPRGQGIVGIGRDDTSFRIIPPPFAVRFNARGHMVSSLDTGSRFAVVYDGDGNGTFDGGAVSPDFNPAPFDPEVATDAEIADKFVVEQSKYKICDCDKFPTVVGVLVYSKADFEDAGGGFPATAPAFGCKDGDCGTGKEAVREWMFDNGHLLFFSRYTGALIRDNMP